MPWKSCSAVYCKSNNKKNKKISFFSFPCNPNFCKEWINKCERLEFHNESTDTLHQTKFLCSLHFEKSQYVILNNKKKKLKKNALPTLFGDKCYLEKLEQLGKWDEENCDVENDILNFSDSEYQNSCRSDRSNSHTNLFESRESCEVDSNSGLNDTTSNGKEDLKQLRSKNHCFTILDQLLKDDTFTDVTLTAQGRNINAHRIVLMMASSYFREVLSKDINVKSVVVFHDIPFHELKLLIHFIYTGDVTIEPEYLGSFLKAAEILQISTLYSAHKALFDSYNTTTNANEENANKERVNIDKNGRKRSASPVSASANKKPTNSETPHSETQHSETPHSETQHSETQHSETPHSGTQHSETQHSETQHSETRHSETPVKSQIETPHQTSTPAIKIKELAALTASQKANKLLDLTPVKQVKHSFQLLEETALKAEPMDDGVDTDDIYDENVENVDSRVASKAGAETDAISRLRNTIVTQDGRSVTASHLSPVCKITTTDEEQKLDVANLNLPPGRCPYCPHQPLEAMDVTNITSNIIDQNPPRPAFRCASCLRVYVKILP